MSYTITVGPGAAGVRVVVRHRLPAGGVTDVLGQLLSWSDDLLRVQRRDGVIVEVAAADVLAAKQIPPAPARRP